ncbi:MAG TPA: PIN domain-containing protein [Longimicrobium sp.]|nr:PIN domain-containing protein [Longimicrobium sp.]
MYVETTIPNFYYDQRTDDAVVTRRRLTREWWGDAHERYELLTGAPVLSELLAGIGKRVSLRISLLSGLPLLLPDTAALNAMDVYVRNKLMPARRSEDALHLALASRYGCDFIVTWNCKHLANPNKRRYLERLNARSGLHVPIITTPADLLGRRTG